MNRALAMAFLAFLVSVPIGDLIQQDRFPWGKQLESLWLSGAGEEPDAFSSLFPWLPEGDAFVVFEEALEESSRWSRWVRPPVQRALTRWLGWGNAEVVLLGDHLTHRPSLDHFLGRPWDSDGGESTRKEPRAAAVLQRWSEELRNRGIRLVVVPIPPKVSRICSEEALSSSRGKRFVGDLRSRGVEVLEVAPDFLTRDTHWTPAGMESTAQAIADLLLGNDWIERGPKLSSTTRLQVSGVGDLARLLEKGSASRWFSEERVTIASVQSWSPDPASAVLLLGDSFTNIYSLPEMGWGANAGLAERLSVSLGFDVDCLAVNGNGARASRDALRLQGAERLKSKRVIVFQFAERELSFGDWRR